MPTSSSLTAGRTAALHNRARTLSVHHTRALCSRQFYIRVPTLHREFREHACCLRAVAQDPFNAEELDKLNVDTLNLDNPFGHVEDVMTELDLKTARSNTLVADVVHELESKTGLPVVDDDNKVVGVLSRKDVAQAKAAGNGYLNGAVVADYMTTPPIVVRARAHIGEAAAVMLANNVHRVPVVDGSGCLIGILSRTDIFKPELLERADTLRALEYQKEEESDMEDSAAAAPSVAVPAQAAASGTSAPATAPETSANSAPSPQDTWQIKYLYDGDCSVCLSLVALLKKQDNGRGIIKFVNIADINYNPADNEYISYDEAMESLHAIRRDGTIIFGPEAVTELYRSVGYGWVATLATLPLVSLLLEGIYNVVSKLRLPVGNAMDAIYAAHRMRKSMDGVEHCTDDEEECEATDW